MAKIRLMRKGRLCDLPFLPGFGGSAVSFRLELILPGTLIDLPARIEDSAADYFSRSGS